MKKDLEVKLQSPKAAANTLERQASQLDPENQPSEEQNTSQQVTVTQKEELQTIQKVFGELFASFKNSHIHSMVGIGAARYSRPAKGYEQDQMRRKHPQDSSMNTEDSSELQGSVPY